MQRSIDNQVLKAFRENLSVLISALNHSSPIGAFPLIKRAMLNGVLLERLLEKIRLSTSDLSNHGTWRGADIPSWARL